MGLVVNLLLLKRHPWNSYNAGRRNALCIVPIAGVLCMYVVGQINVPNFILHIKRVSAPGVLKQNRYAMLVERWFLPGGCASNFLERLLLWKNVYLNLTVLQISL